MSYILNKSLINIDYNANYIHNKNYPVQFITPYGSMPLMLDDIEDDLLYFFDDHYYDDFIIKILNIGHQFLDNTIFIYNVANNENLNKTLEILDKNNFDNKYIKGSQLKIIAKRLFNLEN